MIGLAWGAGTEGSDARDSDNSIRTGRDGCWDVSRLGDSAALRYTPKALDATPTASPAALPTPGVLVQEPAEAEAEGQEAEQQGVVAAGVQPPGVGALVAAFLAGYRFGGGDPQWEQRVLNMIGCESGWQLDPPGVHLGPAQFAPGTWETVAGISGLWDYTNPYHAGYNVAVWMGMIAPSYGSSQGWPNCW